MHTGNAYASRGFTLIELMVTVAIVAILAALAYPSYRDFVLRGQVVDGTNGLTALRANMERYYQDNRTYTSNGSSPCDAPANIGSFSFKCTVPDGNSYSITATGSGNTSGFVYGVDQAGKQSSTITGVRGWNGCASAWATKPGPAC